jgi:uncharacterized RDD family membrane protein YckC
MNWFYAESGAQKGPVDDAALDSLAQAGVIRPDTLVWNESIPNWLPLSQARPGAAPAAVPGAAYTCASCQGQFAANQVVMVGNAWVCANCKPAYLQQLREGTPTFGMGRVVYASFMIRFAARFIDGVILGIVGFVVGAVAGFVMASTRNPSAALAAQGISFIINAIIAASYEGYFLSTKGATPGKSLLNIRVIKADGSPVTFGTGVARYFATYLSSFTLFIGYLMAAFDDEGRSLHDRIVGTRVIQN